MEKKTIRTQLMDLILELPALSKDGLNDHHGNKYITLDQIINRLKPLEQKHRLCITHDVQSDTIPDSASMQVTVKTVAWNEAGESIEGSPMTAVCTQNVQQIGSAVTYLKRYTLAAFLGISADEDDDGNAIHKAHNEPVKVPPKQVKVVPPANAMSPSQKAEIVNLKTEIFGTNSKGAMQYISDNIGRKIRSLDLTTDEAEKAIDALVRLSGRERGKPIPDDPFGQAAVGFAKVESMYLETIEPTWEYVKGLNDPEVAEAFRTKIATFRPRPHGEWDEA